MIPPQPLCFVTDCTLGRLAKWLRLMGFDTQFDPRPPDALQLKHLAEGKRLILTRSPGVFAKLAGTRALLIDSERPARQIRQIIRQLDIHREQLKPLARCANCNASLVRLPKAEAAGRVPDYVLVHHHQFHQCPLCQRIYWPGTHPRRWELMIGQWFNHLDHYDHHDHRDSAAKGDNQT